MAKKSTIQKAQYDAVNSRFYHIKLNRKTDADIIAKLESQKSMQGYIRELIRADIAAEGEYDDEQ